MKHLVSNAHTDILSAGVILNSRFTTVICGILCLFVLFHLQACTPVVYQINLKYIPSERSPKQHHPQGKITVAVFNDIRQIDDRLLLGRIQSASGDVIPILPRYGRVPEAVTNNVQDFLARSGYRINEEKPSWDLTESAIKPTWGKLLIGGNIDSLEIVGESSIAVTTYRTKVRLTFVIADPISKKIIYRSSVETTSALKDISLSGERIEQEINTALTNALTKMFNDPGTIKRVNMALSNEGPK